MKKANRNMRIFFNMNNIFLMFCLFLVLILLINTFQMKNVSTYLLPRLLCIFCLTAIIVSLAIEYFKLINQSDVKEKKDLPQGLNIFYVVVFAGAYFVLIPVLGFVLATSAALIIFSYLSGYKTKKIIYPVAVLLPVVFHYLFVSLLQVRLPAGFLDSLLSF